MLGEDQDKDKDDHRSAEREVQEVVGNVDGDEFRGAVAVDSRSVDGQQEVDGAAAKQELAGPDGGSSRDQADDAEQAVNDVVQNAGLEQPDELGRGVTAGERQVVVAGGDAGDEPDDGASRNVAATWTWEWLRMVFLSGPLARRAVFDW